jgi:hypothetical protein
MGGQGAEIGARSSRHRHQRLRAAQAGDCRADLERFDGNRLFQVSGHDIAQADIDAAFGRAEQLFALPPETKAQWPLSRNAGWEHKAQIRPSTRTPTRKSPIRSHAPQGSVAQRAGAAGQAGHAGF